MIATKSIFCFG